MVDRRSLDELREERRDNFIRSATERYQGAYDYSQIDFVDSKTPVELNCETHGNFRVRPAAHLNGQHCRSCKKLANAASNREKTTAIFVNKARLVHGDIFDYSRATEIDESGRCVIICPNHGAFWQFRGNHLEGRGCQLCSNEARTTTVAEFIERARAVHGDATFDYSRVEQFKSTQGRVLIICPDHGEFLQAARDHMRGVGCSQCSQLRSKVTFAEFVARARTAHGDRYEYLEDSWGAERGFVTVICPDHGAYRQNWYNHSIGMGCGRCRSFVSKPEIEIFELISEAASEEVLQSDRKVICPKELDIWIPELRLSIEFNGTAYHDKAAWADSRSGDSWSREREKSAICAAQGIRLLQVWEDDYKLEKEWWSSAILRSLALARSGNLEGLDRMIEELELKASERIPEITGQLGVGRAKRDHG